MLTMEELGFLVYMEEQEKNKQQPYQDESEKEEELKGEDD